MISCVGYIKSLANKVYLPFKDFFGKSTYLTIPSGDPKAYWSIHNVHVPKHSLSNAAESFDYFHWRCGQYPVYLELMPVARLDGLNIFDFDGNLSWDKAGPGINLVLKLTKI